MAPQSPFPPPKPPTESLATPAQRPVSAARYWHMLRAGDNCGGGVRMDTVEFGNGLRARLATDRGIAPVDQRPIYELLRSADLAAVREADHAAASPSAASLRPELRFGLRQ